MPATGALVTPASDVAVVTPHNTNTIAECRGLFVGGAGHLKVTMADGEDVTFSNVPAGRFMPIRATRVFATGTTATSIMAYY